MYTVQSRQGSDWLILNSWPPLPAGIRLHSQCHQCDAGFLHENLIFTKIFNIYKQNRRFHLKKFTEAQQVLETKLSYNQSVIWTNSIRPAGICFWWTNKQTCCSWCWHWSSSSNFNIFFVKKYKVWNLSYWNKVSSHCLVNSIFVDCEIIVSIDLTSTTQLQGDQNKIFKKWSHKIMNTTGISH